MPTYYIAQRREMIDGTTDEKMEPLFEELRKALAEYEGRAFGRADDFVIRVVIDAETPDEGRERWYQLIDPIIDRAIRSNRTRQKSGPEVSEKT